MRVYREVQKRLLSIGGMEYQLLNIGGGAHKMSVEYKGTTVCTLTQYTEHQGSDDDMEWFLDADWGYVDKEIYDRVVRVCAEIVKEADTYYVGIDIDKIIGYAWTGEYISK